MGQKRKDTRIDRREALKNMSVVFAAVGSMPALAGNSPEAVFAQGKSIHKHLPAETAKAAKPVALAVFSAHQNETVTTLSELIIPQTATAGAKAARVNEFIDTFLSSVSSSEKQEFLEGLQWLDKRSLELFQRPFVRATSEQQTELLVRLSVPHSLESPIGQEFFKEVKSLTVFGYYTSKVGLEEELKFSGWVEYQGCSHPEHLA